MKNVNYTTKQLDQSFPYSAALPINKIHTTVLVLCHVPFSCRSIKLYDCNDELRCSIVVVADPSNIFTSPNK